jgi:negative regulator of sigma E activity
MTQTSFRDVEQLSALLDDKLNPADAARLQKRLESDPDLRALYDDLRQARSLLRQLPQRRAPRNFTLKASAARVRPPLPQIFPVFRLASALASLLLFFSLATNATLPRLAIMASQAPAYAYGMGGGPDIDRSMSGGGSSEDAAEPEMALQAAPAETEMPQIAAKAAQPTSEPAPEIAAVPAEEAAQPAQSEQASEQTSAESLPPAPIPGWVLAALAVIAAASGGAALLLRWQTDRQWQRKTKTPK